MQEKISQFLDYSQKIVRTDVRYVLRGYFWFFVEYGVSAFTGLATSVAFANLLPPETYGNFKYILTFLPFLSLSALKRINDSLAISVAKNCEGDTLRVLRTKIKWGLLGGLGGILISLYYFQSGNTTLAYLALIMAFFVPLIDSPFIYSSYLIGKKNFKILALLNAACSITYAITIVAAIWLSKNIFFILLIYFTINVLTRFIALFLTLKLYPPNDKREEKTISFGKKFSFLEIITTLASYLDNILVFHYLGAAQLAAYAFIKKVPEEIKNLPGFLTTLASPKFAVKNINDPLVKRESLRKSLLLSLFMLGAVLIYVALAPLFFSLFFKPYVSYVFLSQLYALSLPIGAFAVLIQNFIESTRQEKILIKYNIIFPILKIAVLFGAVKFYGLYGLIISFMIIRFLSPAILSYFFYFRTESDQISR